MHRAKPGQPGGRQQLDQGLHRKYSSSVVPSKGRPKPGGAGQRADQFMHVGYLLAQLVKLVTCEHLPRHVAYDQTLMPLGKLCGA
jgi:hypothetical protein